MRHSQEWPRARRHSAPPSDGRVLSLTMLCIQACAREVEHWPVDHTAPSHVLQLLRAYLNASNRVSLYLLPVLLERGITRLHLGGLCDVEGGFATTVAARRAQLPDEVLRVLTQRCVPSLTWLSFSGNRLLSDNVLCSLWRALRGAPVQHVSLRECWALQRPAWQPWMLAHVTHFDASHCSQLSDASLALVARHAPLLRTLDLGFCSQVTQGTICAFVTSCTHLEALSLVNTKVSDHTLATIAQHATNLTTLNVSRSWTLRAGFARLAEAPWVGRLQQLDCSHCWTLLDEHVVALADALATGLVGLSVAHCTGLTDVGVLALCAATRLQLLSLNGLAPVTHGVVRQLGRCLPDLRTLKLGRCHNVADVMHALCRDAHWTMLESLNLCALRVTDETMQALCTTYPRLHTLSMSGNDVITDRGLLPIASCLGPNLKRLSISGRVSHQGLSQLFSHCTNLTALNVSGCESETVTTPLFHALAEHCRGLVSLNMAQSTLVRDADVEWLVRHCRNLAHLNLSSCLLITHACVITVVQQCPWLRSLIVTNSRRVARAVVRQRFPHLYNVILSS